MHWAPIGSSMLNDLKCSSKTTCVVTLMDSKMYASPRSITAPRKPKDLKCPFDQMFGIPHFYIFVKSMTFLLNLPNFKSS